MSELPRLFRARPAPPAAVEAALRTGERREARAIWRRRAGGLAVLALIAGALYAAHLWLRPGYVDHLRAERAAWKDSRFISPGQEAVDPATGEVTLPFQGFGVYADSVPDGARVSAGGRALGETPAATAVACTAGETVTVRFEKAGFRTQEVSTRCRRDAMVKLKVALRR